LFRQYPVFTGLLGRNGGRRLPAAQYRGSHTYMLERNARVLKKTMLVGPHEAAGRDADDSGGG
jgi:hypothetical protein